MPLAQATNRWIAGHYANLCSTHRHKRCPRLHPCGRSGSFSAGVAAPNDNDLEMFHVKHPHFPMQKLEKISSSTSSTSTRPISESRARMAWRSNSAASSTRSGPAFTSLRADSKARIARETASKCRARLIVAADADFCSSASPTASTSVAIPAPVLPDTASPPGGARSAFPRTKMIARSALDQWYFTTVVQQKDAQIRSVRARNRARDPDLLDLVLRIAQSCCIQHSHGKAAHSHAHFDHIPRRPRNGLT